MGAKSAIRVESTAIVAAVFASNATARFPPASRSAIIPEPITVAAKSMDPKPSATSARRSMLGKLSSSTAFSDVTQFGLQRHTVERPDRQTGKELDASFEPFECLTERERLFSVRAFNRRRVGDSPVRRHRFSRPDRTHLTGRVVADGEYEIDWRCSRRRELIPALAAKALGRQIPPPKEFQRHGMHLTLRKTP